MKAPKILPWVARQAGLDDALTLHLWRRAAGESEALYGNCESADYFKATMLRFLDLVDHESERLATGTRPDGETTAWIWRHQKRMALLAKLAAENLCRLWLSSFVASPKGWKSTA